MVGGAKVNFVPKSTNRPFQKLEVNLVSLSEIIALGNTCNLKISFMKIFAMASALYVDLTSIKCDSFSKEKNVIHLLICPPQP